MNNRNFKRKSAVMTMPVAVRVKILHKDQFVELPSLKMLKANEQGASCAEIAGKTVIW
ncbi:hypothetical protein KCP71_20950 [Salmonella enterica subsp. enterica]|nr:hypothetical protein KCP71_20950 [Salmonella enterica subsp. enterica]